MTSEHERLLPFRADCAFDVVAFAASAGGLGALSTILSNLPENFPAAILIVQHLDPKHKSLMAHILQRRTALKTCEAQDGDVLEAAKVFVAPPDVHMILLHQGVISLVHSDRVNYVRPSANLLFVSVASAYPGRAIAVILSGTGSDGSTGAIAIKKSGGVVIAQDQASSEYFGMPSASIETGSVDFILPLEQIPQKLIELTSSGRSSYE